jgi:PAS domain S-box-containing protein
VPENRDNPLLEGPRGLAKAPGLARIVEDAILIGDTSGTITEVNAALCALTGYRRSELIGTNGAALVAPEWVEFSMRQRQRKVEALEETTRYDCVFLTKDGTRVPVEVTSTLIRRDGEITAVRAAVRDTRKASATERRLLESEERFRGAFDGAAIGMAMVAPDGRWLRVNDALTRLLGYGREELLDLTFQDLTHPDDLERDLDAVHDVLAGRISWYHMEKRYIRKDGTCLWGLLAVSLVRSSDGEPAYFVSQISDITAAKHTETTRLATLAQLPDETRNLSPRERQVLHLLAAGQLTSEAAETLNISEETIQTLVKRAMKKLGARNRTHAVAKATALGWLHQAAPSLATPGVSGGPDSPSARPGRS